MAAYLLYHGCYSFLVELTWSAFQFSKLVNTFKDTIVLGFDGFIVWHIPILHGMVSHMKTTIQIPDSLFEEVRKLAQREHTTMKAIVEEGLRRIVSERQRRGRFRLRKATFRGKGLQPHLIARSWD